MSYDANALYRFGCKWFAIIPPLATVATSFYNAPFGRFSRGSSRWMVDGIKSWIIMELVSPLCLTLTYLAAPLQPPSFAPVPLSARLNPFTHPPALLFYAFLTHYANRALISPLRTPSRSQSHIIVPLAAVAVNLVNGSLMGTYLASPQGEAWLRGAYARWGFWVGVGVWAAGLAGNMLHDEVLLELRRDAMRKKAKDGEAVREGRMSEGEKGEKAKAKVGEHYAIPYGYLYRFVSYPNYLCEWVEWAGFAFAAAPLPSLHSKSGLLTSASHAITSGAIPPPWLFVLMELCTMSPRAYRGHEWYHQKFGAAYPKERRAVVPFIF